MPRALIISAALIAMAILVHEVRSQATTTLFATAWVVATCGTPPVTTGSASGWSYTANSQAPLTMNPGGALCVNQ